MIKMLVQVTSDFHPAKIKKELKIGLATGLTRTAQFGQNVVKQRIKSDFTARGGWWEKNRKFGIKITSAKHYHPAPYAEVKTQAEWLIDHERGAVRKPSHGRKVRGVPTTNVRRTGRGIIGKSQRPKAFYKEILKAGRFLQFIARHSAFVRRRITRRTLKDKYFMAGKHLIRRKYRGRRSQTEKLYTFVRHANLKRTSVFFDPLNKVVHSFARKFVSKEILNGLRKARSKSGGVTTRATGVSFKKI